MIEVYYINLDRSIDRRADIMKSIQHNQIILKRFKAFDGLFINLNTIKYLKKNNYINELTDNNYIYLKKGRVGTYMSHILLWEKLNKENKRYGIIFEDDINIAKNINSCLKNIINNLPKEWDFIFLGYDGINKSLFYNYNNLYLVASKDSKYYGLWGYIINLNNYNKIKNIISTIPPNIPHIDNFIRDNNKLLKIYFLKKRIILHKNEYSIRKNTDLINT